MSRTLVVRGVTPCQKSSSRLLVASLIALSVVAPLASSPASAASAKKVSGTLDVLYAGSLLDLMQQQLDPAFQKATGYTVSGFSAGSTALASEIKGGTEVGDVFISASRRVNATLQGTSNGDWVSSYREFGFSRLVLGYNPKSKFAKFLKTKPWYNVVDMPGFLLGRTDPATDPKGVLAVDALEGTALSHNLPVLNAMATSTSNIFAETALVGELQAGQLDAGFFYGVEAAATQLKTVPLKGTDLSGDYTVAILNRAPHEAAAKAFVKFLLSAPAQRILKRNGVTPIVPPKVRRASTTTTTSTLAPTTTTS